jgi:prepilin-type N-terminal cleavage/methylation domain-containing protein
MKGRQKGFSLVEVAIVLVIIGMLRGGIIKGQEMVNSAKVRNLADVSAAIQTAYFGFIDRYRNVPGDWGAAPAATAIGVAITGGGNNNGRLDNPPGASVYNEASALWEQVSKAGFIQGAYLGTPNVEPNTTNNLSPLNAFNNVVTIGRTGDFEGVSPVKLHVVVGRGVPVNIIQELDIKVDDGVPNTGIIRATVADGAVTVFAGANTWGGREAACVIGAAPMVWDIANDAQDCNGVLLF